MVEQTNTPLAAVREIARDALQYLLPPVRQTVDEYASAHRLLPARSGTGLVPWRHEEAPYLAAPMRCATMYEHLTVCIAGPAQCGKTASAENIFQHAVEKQPRNVIWYMQTDEGIEAYVKKTLNPMIQAHAGMSARLGPKPEDDALHFKRFAGMSAEFLSFTDNNLIGRNAPLIIADEWDAYDPSIGDPKALLDRRRQYYGRMSMR